MTFCLLDVVVYISEILLIYLYSLDFVFWGRCVSYVGQSLNAW